MQLGGIGREMRVLAVDAHARNIKIHGIEIELLQTVVQRRKRVRHLADDFALVHVEAQLDARVFEMVFAGGREGLVARATGHASRGPPASITTSRNRYVTAVAARFRQKCP